MSSQHQEPDASAVKLEEEETQIQESPEGSVSCDSWSDNDSESSNSIEAGDNTPSEVLSPHQNHGRVPTLVLARSGDNGQGSALHKRRPRKITLPITTPEDEQSAISKE